MLTTHYKLWSLAVFSMIGLSLSSPSILRSKGVVAELQADSGSSCSQQLEKLKQETVRHVSALNAITDSLAWRNRRLFSTVQPIDSQPKSLSNSLLVPRAVSRVRKPGKTEQLAKNYLVKYLSSLDHYGWVSECLNGGKCSTTVPEDEATESRVFEQPVASSMDGSRIASNDSTETATIKPSNDRNSTDDGGDEMKKVEVGTLHLDGPLQNSGIVSDPINTRNVTKFNPIIDLLSSSYSQDDFESETPLSNTTMINEKSYSPLINQSATNHKSKEVYHPEDTMRTDFNPLNDENANDPIKKTGDFTIWTDPVLQKGSIYPEPVYSSLIGVDESSSLSTGNYFLLAEDGNFIPFNSSRYLPRTNQFMHYNNHFLPLAISLTPRKYYHRYPRGGSLSLYEAPSTNGVIEKTFAPNTDIQTQKFPLPTQTLLRSKENTHEVDSLDSLVSNYGNDLFRRDSTGKRELEFPTPKKEAVTTNYPEMPSSYTLPGTNKGKTFTRVAPGEIGSDPNIYLFLGGNYVASFKDKPQVFYIQPQSLLSPIHQSVSEVPANRDDSSQLSHTSSDSPNCPSNRKLATQSGSNLPRPYPQASYGVDERNLEQRTSSTDPNSGRAANGMKFSSLVAARNGYSWYDYNSMMSDVNSVPVNGPSNIGPIEFPTTGQFSNTPDENIKGLSRPRMVDLNYESSLVNFPSQTYVPPAPGQNDISVLKPEELMEHDIDTADMFAVGTQFLAIFPQTSPKLNVDDSNITAFGNLVADVSSRSVPGMRSRLQERTETAFTASTAPSLKSQGIYSPYRPAFQATSMNFPSRPDEFEFVSGQWVKRRPITDTASSRLIYDQVGRRRIRDVVVGWPEIQQPTHPIKSECFAKIFDNRFHAQPSNAFHDSHQQMQQPNFGNTAYYLERTNY